MNKIIILFSSFPDFSGNAKALYEYMAKFYKNKMKLLWVIYDKESILSLKKYDIKFVLYGTQQFYELIKMAKVIFDTHNLLLNDKINGQFYINLLHGVGPKKKGYLLKNHQLALQDRKYNYLSSTKVDYIIVPSEICRIIYNAVFNYDIDRILPLGMPRCDYLFSANGKRNLQILLRVDVFKFEKILIYLPTFRQGINRFNDGSFNDNILNLKSYNEKKLLDFLTKKNYLLIIKLHPSEEKIIKKIIHSNIVYLNEQNHIKNNLSLYEYLNAVDLLITDYSSVYLEYLLLKRPVLFIHTDINKYQYNRGFVFEYIDFWFPGPKISKIDNFINEATKLLINKNYYLKKRLSFINLMFNNFNNYSCKRICDFLFDNYKISKCCSLKMDIEYSRQEKINNMQKKYDRALKKIVKLKKDCYLKKNELTLIACIVC